MPKNTCTKVSNLSNCFIEIGNNNGTINTDIEYTFSTLVRPGIEPDFSEIAIP